MKHTPTRSSDPHAPKATRPRHTPSAALARWQSRALPALDQIATARRALGGTGRGRRYATLQVDHAYAMLVSSQFQGFCRDLHSEAVAFLVRNTTPSALGPVFGAALMQARKLDHGNPNAGHLGSDFGRLGMDFWASVSALDSRHARRKRKLDTLNVWRNAIAHQDWSAFGPSLRLTVVRAWRSSCESLAIAFDVAVARHLRRLVGVSPW